MQIDIAGLLAGSEECTEQEQLNTIDAWCAQNSAPGTWRYCYSCEAGVAQILLPTAVVFDWREVAVLFRLRFNV